MREEAVGREEAASGSGAWVPWVQPWRSLTLFQGQRGATEDYIQWNDAVSVVAWSDHWCRKLENDGGDMAED